MIVLVYDREKIIEFFSSMGPSRYEPVKIILQNNSDKKLKNREEFYLLVFPIIIPVLFICFIIACF